MIISFGYVLVAIALAPISSSSKWFDQFRVGMVQVEHPLQASGVAGFDTKTQNQEQKLKNFIDPYFKVSLSQL